VTLAFPVAQTEDFYAADGGSAVRTYTVPLHERAGWLQDSANTLVEWEAPTQCAMVEVLSGLSAVRILGDFTTGHESVALDNVALRQTAGTSHVPVCAQQRGGATLTGDNDASACTCDPTPAAATLLARQSSSTAFDVKRSPAAPRNAHAAEGQGFAVPPVAGVSLSPDAFRTIREAVVKAWDYGLIGYHEEQKCVGDRAAVAAAAARHELTSPPLQVRHPLLRPRPRPGGLRRRRGQDRRRRCRRRRSGAGRRRRGRRRRRGQQDERTHEGGG
jgi:hypothetical protein